MASSVQIKNKLYSQDSQESQPEQNDHEKSVQRLLNVLGSSGDSEKWTLQISKTESSNQANIPQK